MMKRILAIVARDFKSGTRDWLIVYLSIAPLLIAFILRLFIPSAGNSLLHLAMLEDDALAETMTTYATVEVFDDLEAIEQRVMKTDDILGLVTGADRHKIIRQGNEIGDLHTLLETLLKNIESRAVDAPIDVRVSDVGFKISPLQLEGGTLLLIMTTVFGGMLIVLNLVDEKMYQTLQALNVAPVRRYELILGKGFLGLLLPIIGALGAVWILGFKDIHFGMFLVTLLSISLISMIIGFLIGVMNNEPIAAIASMKMIFVPVLASVFGAMFLSDKWHPLLYWSPFYWAYDSLHAIFLKQATWPLILTNALWVVLITAAVFVGLRKRINRGFN